MSSSNIMIPRHSLSDRFIHWGNAALWFMLLATGLALIDNGVVAPFTQGYSHALRQLLGGGGNLIALHIFLGVIWISSFALYLIVNWRGAVFFLRSIFTPAQGDFIWLFRKGLQMSLGKKMTARLGVSLELPPQGYYNSGQKALAVAIVFCCLGIAASGVFMSASTTFGVEQYPMFVALVPWALLLHHICVFLALAGLIIHIYMAALSLEERPGLQSMLSGSVPESYARHHHPLWLEQLEAEKK